jgi:predicted RNA-binding protein YlxR (DUF448 family)
MSDKSTHHNPIRTCVICRKKDLKKNLLRFVIINGEPVYDIKKVIAQRGFYVCDDNVCIGKVKKWIKKRK